jgi:hypothetical protein
MVFLFAKVLLLVHIVRMYVYLQCVSCMYCVTVFMLCTVMYDEYCISYRYLWEMKCRLILSSMYISYDLVALNVYEGLTKTLYGLNIQLCTAGVLLIQQCDHK